MKLKRGDVLVKRRGGGTRRMRVVHLSKTGHVTLEALAPSVQVRGRDKVTSLVLAVGYDGLPEGYQRAPEGT